MKHYSDEYPKEATVRDGRPITIRLLTPDYEDLITDLFAKQKKKDMLYLKSNMSDPLQVQKYLDRHDVVRLFALRKNKAVGVASLYLDIEGWSQHVGELRSMVRSGMHGIGIATTLLKEIVHISQMRGIDKLIAQIPANDAHTRKIYRMMGFRQEAALKSHVKDWRGNVQDLIISSRHTDDLWHQMEELVSYFSPE